MNVLANVIISVHKCWRALQTCVTFIHSFHSIQSRERFPQLADVLQQAGSDGMGAQA